MQLNDKKVDKRSLQVDGVDRKDYPDFCDAYFAAGWYEDGTELTEDELNRLADEYPEIVWDMAFESMH